MTWLDFGNFRRDFGLESSMSNMEFAISQPKKVRLPWDEKQTIDWHLGLKCDHRVWPWPWPWPWIFKIKYGICYISAKNGRLKSMPQIWPMGLTLAMIFIFRRDLTFNFQGQIWNLLYLRQKWPDCHKTKSICIDGTLGLKCKHRIWPWPWHWSWILKVKYRLCYISAKIWSDCHDTKSKHIEWTLGLKCNQWDWPWPWSWPWIFQVRSKEFAISFDKMIRLPENEKQVYRFHSRLHFF